MTQTGARPLAVVTGASSGIGIELAKQFAQNGCTPVHGSEAAVASVCALGRQDIVGNVLADR